MSDSKTAALALGIASAAACAAAVVLLSDRCLFTSIPVPKKADDKVSGNSRTLIASRERKSTRPTIRVARGQHLDISAKLAEGELLRVDIYEEGSRNTEWCCGAGLALEDGEQQTIRPRPGKYEIEVLSVDGSRGTVSVEAVSD